MALTGSPRRKLGEYARRHVLAARRWHATVRGSKEIHPFPGLLRAGEVDAIIQKVWFDGGRLHIEAVSGAGATGSTYGLTKVLGMDGEECLSREFAYQGVKGAFAVWTFTVDFDLNRD